MDDPTNTNTIPNTASAFKDRTTGTDTSNTS